MDYANRGRPPQKKKGGRKPAGKKTGRPSRKGNEHVRVPWSVVILAVVLVAGFAWFLISINGQADETPTPQSVVEQPVSNADKLPLKPDERWQYIEELENKEVEVDVPVRELGPPQLMQCGSFRSQSDAETLRARIAMAGLESQVRPSDGANGRWYRVILGPYETKRDGERDRHKLQRVQIFGCQIWTWNLDEL